MRIAAIVYLSLLCTVFIAVPSSNARTTAHHKSKAVSHSKESSNSKEFSGMADYYHHKFYGRKTASGEVLEKDRLTAAHRTLPFGTRLKVTNKRNGTSCIVVINDRGPFTSGKVIDLSHAAARKLGVLSAGTALVACRVVDKDEVDESNNDED